MPAVDAFVGDGLADSPFYELRAKYEALEFDSKNDKLIILDLQVEIGKLKEALREFHAIDD